MLAVDANGSFKLARGYSAETSGGLLVALPGMEAAKQFVAEISQLDRQPAWIVGSVELSQDSNAKESTAVLVDGYTVLEI